MAKTKRTYDFIDLFAGLGGIRLGFQQALAERGLKGRCVFTSEIKAAAITALNHNFPGEDIKPTDITAVKSEDIPSFRILLGGFPCQAFSSAGARRGFADTRGTLFFEVERILTDKLRGVDGFLLENVEGLVLHDRASNQDNEGRTIKIIMKVLRDKLKFNAEYVVLDAADFGVPQRRKRVYIVGCKKRFGKIDLNFTPQPRVMVGEILEHGKPTLDSEFSRKLLSVYEAKDMVGKSLNDKRGGARNFHSWDIDARGTATPEERDLLNAILRERRKRYWADIIGIVWKDGMPLTTEQIRSFHDVPHLQEMLDDLCAKKYLRLEYPKNLVVHHEDDGTTWTERKPVESLPMGYNIITGKLSFEFSAFLDTDRISHTLVATDMTSIGIVDGDGIRHLTLREGLRLFGYPETYSLAPFEDGPKATELGYDLIGNSVCVPVIKAVAGRLLDTINVQ